MDNNKIFVYGILKRGHAASLSEMGGRFICEATLKNAQLYWLANRIGVGLKFELGKGPARGEVWEIPNALWPILDGMEGVAWNVYKRVEAYAMAGGERHKVQVYIHTYYEDGKAYNDPIPNNWF